MNRIGNKYCIHYQILERIFHYTGIIIEEDDSFLTINDFKEGDIQLNKKNILSIKEVQQ